MKLIRGLGISFPKGFLASGIHCGIKKRKPDIALLYSEKPCKAVAVFTQNKVKAAHIYICKKYLANQIQAILVNSGNANCLTGKKGISDAQAVIKEAASVLSISYKNVLIASTGVIGKFLPVDTMKKAIPRLAKNLSKNKRKFAKAILTTDKCTKQAAAEIIISGKSVRIGATAKGAGMIQPNMATMLCFITTDADIDKKAMKKAIKKATEPFNHISVDGDMSTNDSVFLFANAQAENNTIKEGTAEFDKFCIALSKITEYLSKKIILDGEGATKFVEIVVTGAVSDDSAFRMAQHISNSPLVKTSFYGHDPNFGRIAAALGSSGEEVDQDKIDIYIGRYKVAQNGVPVNIDENKLNVLYDKKDIFIKVNLNLGKGKSKYYTCDLSNGYINTNARYIKG